MFSFFVPKNYALGIDIGTTGIKVVELKKEGSVPVLTNYAFSYDFHAILQSNGLNMLDDQTTEVLKKVLEKGNFKTNRAVIGIPSFLALITFIEIPEIPPDEIEQAVKLEAAKFIPTPIEEVSLGWEIISNSSEKSVEGGRSSLNQKKIQIMVVTVPKNIVEKLSNIAKNSGLVVTSMEVDNFAQLRSLIGNDKGTFLILNIGSKTTDFTVVSEGFLRLTRSIDVGGVELTRAIASGMGIDAQRADEIKKTSRIDLLSPGDKIALLISPVLGIIIDEVKRIQNIFHKKNPVRKIEKIILTGGSSKIPTLTEYFSKNLSIDCQLGKTLARIGLEEKYKEIAEEVAAELSIAVGLALRGIEKI